MNLKIRIKTHRFIKIKYKKNIVITIKKNSFKHNKKSQYNHHKLIKNIITQTQYLINLLNQKQNQRIITNFSVKHIMILIIINLFLMC